ncbi:MAG: chalcone isomerase family protein [Acidobacteria bacterium]|nr:chalcone isomerase family protein [Acidobacteriota bacterium]
MRYLLCLFAAGVAFSGEIGGVTLPDKMTVGDASLVLNGAGLRKKLFIKVYAGGLYLQAKSSDQNKVIKADEPMAVRLHFIYDGVSSEKLTEAWNEGFKNATGGKTAAIQAKIDTFNGMFSQTANKGDVYDVIYEPGKGTSVLVNGVSKGTVEGLEFKQAVFGIWLCDKPADSGLKEGMLHQ